MLDNLKEHIEDKREDFEIYPFDGEASWNEISGKISPRKKWATWKVASVAACLVLVVLGSISQMDVANEDNELSEVELFYQNEINHKITLVKTQLDDPSILADLEAMDKAFSELKADLKDNVDNEEVVSAMMENYQLKLRILEEILGELAKENDESRL